MFNIVLVRPEIAPNTGNAIRLAANTGCTLHLVEPLGFSMEDRLLRRAGLDYHETARVQRHASWQALIDEMQPDPARLFAFSTHARLRFADVHWRPGDWLVFGAESSGLPADVRNACGQQVRLPMRPQQRSLNLSNAVAVAVFEAWRQNGYTGGV